MSLEFRSLWVVVLLLAGGGPATGWALDPHRQVTQYLHRSWDGDRGLPQNSVFSVAQTPDGHLWVGTWEGLARFDGAAFTVFDHRNTPALKLNGILALAVDREGRLWVGTEEGLLLHQAGGLVAVAEPPLEHARITALLPARDGALWIGTAKGLFRRTADGVRQVPVPVIPSGTPYITSLAEDRDGVLWVTSGKNLARLKEGQLLASLPELDGPGTVVAAASGGGVWVARGGPSPVVGHFQGDQLKRLPAPPTERINTLREDRGGTLWLGTAQGLMRWNGQDWAQLGLSRSQADEVLTLFESAEGGLWTGTASSGLHRLSDSPMRVFGQPEGLTSDQTFPILEDRSGAIWIGTHNGLNRLRDGKVETFGPAQGLTAEYIRTLAEGPPGTLWLGAANGLFRYDGARFVAMGPAQGLPTEPVFTLATDSEGALWISYPSGLHEYREGKVRKLGVSDGIPKGPIHKIYEGSRRQLWLGGAVGLFLLQDGKAKKLWPEEGREAPVLDLHEAAPGELWFGTLRGLGLWRDGQPISIFTAREGLFDEAVFRILQDQDNHLWMSCNRGLFRMSRTELLAVAEGRAPSAGYRVFDRSSGMRSAEANGTTQPAGIRTRDGHLWFPTLRGAVTFDPSDPRLGRPAPAATLDAVLTGDGRRLPPTSELSFPPSVRGLEFHFGALDFDDAEQLRFRYRLGGHEEDWVEAGTRRVAHYANLRPGDYQFEVQVTRPRQPFSDQRAKAAVTFQAHWWESLWFYVLAAGLGTALTAGFYLLRVGRLKSHERELEARVAERTCALERANGELDEHLRTLRQTQAQLVEAGKLAAVGTLAAGVGHEINNPLAYIVSNLHFARAEIDALERASTPAQRQEAVTEVQQALEESLQGADRVRRIVQDLKTFSRKEEEDLPGPVDLHQVLDSATKLASGELRHRARITRQYGNLSKVEANPGRLGQVFLNLLINAAHAIPEGHASTHEVLLTTRQEGSWAVVEIKDSGAGMSPEVLARIFEPFFTTKPVGVGTGLGLSLCRTYLTAMGATLEAESAPGRGSTFRLRLKLAGAEDAARPEPVAAPSSPGAMGRVLVIDDDPLVVTALTRILREHHQVDSQSSAREALELLTGPQLPYHVVLCDLMMPEMTGMELHAQLLRTHPERARQLVFITGGAFTEQSREFLERVDNLRMEKPFQLDQLRELIALRVAAAQQSRRAA